MLFNQFFQQCVVSSDQIWSRSRNQVHELFLEGDQIIVIISNFCYKPPFFSRCVFVRDKKIKTRNHKVSKFHLSDSVCSDLASVIANASTDMKQKAMNDDKTVEYNNNNNNNNSNNNCNEQQRHVFKHLLWLN